jgi:bifunctional enzyme CysN/CysC
MASTARRRAPHTAADVVIATAAAPAVPAPEPPGATRPAGRALDGLLHVLTCGSVDDGKSTLIGRLLWDAADLPDDTRAAVLRQATRTGGQPDYSLLVDGLVAEREQGITIDIAWRYVDSDRRRLVVIDSPGHERYTRNMASGASQADVAVMLVDARTGVKPQTRRHAAILQMAGVRRVVLAVNKMDLVGWSQANFDLIAAEFARLAARLGFEGAVAIPLSATGGDNVATRSDRARWYGGPTLVEHLESLPPRASQAGGPFRLPVQTVLRDGRDFRGLAGTVTSGRVAVGDRVVDVVSGQTSRVRRIATMDGDLDVATTGRAVALQLDDDLDLARGVVLAGVGALPVATREIEAQLVWLSETPFDPTGRYLLRSATDEVTAADVTVTGLVDPTTLEVGAAGAAGCGLNDIAIVRIVTARTVALDRFADVAGTGTVMVIDAATGASLAAGVVTRAHETTSAAVVPLRGPAMPAAVDDDRQPFVLTTAMLADGLNADLTDSAADRAEAARRTAEVAEVLRAAGVVVIVEP